MLAAIDWYGRLVASWRMSNTLDGSFCQSMLRESLTRGRPEVFDTDQGVRFTTTDWTSRLESAGMRVRMDGVDCGRPPARKRAGVVCWWDAGCWNRPVIRASSANRRPDPAARANRSFTTFTPSRSPCESRPSRFGRSPRREHAAQLHSPPVDQRRTVVDGGDDAIVGAVLALVQRAPHPRDGLPRVRAAQEYHPPCW